jgi:hypothetical protein
MSLPSDVAQTKEEQILHIKNNHLINKFSGYYGHHGGNVLDNLLHHVHHLVAGHDHHEHTAGYVPAPPSFNSLSADALADR